MPTWERSKGRGKADVMRKASSLRNLDGPLLVCSLQSTKGTLCGCLTEHVTAMQQLV